MNTKRLLMTGAVSALVISLASCGGGGGCDEDFSAFVRDLIFNQTADSNQPVEVGGTDFCGTKPENNQSEFNDLFG